MLNLDLRITKQEINKMSPAGKEKMKELLMDNDAIELSIDHQGYAVSITDRLAENVLRNYLTENRYAKSITKDMGVPELWREVKDMLKKK
ncbi:MAG: hypothetical protein AAB519_02580 [Patescibacteria group bacterium]